MPFYLALKTKEKNGDIERIRIFKLPGYSVWYFLRKTAPKRSVIIRKCCFVRVDVTLLEEVCHFGGGL